VTLKPQQKAKIEELAKCMGAKRIAKEVGCGRMTVKRYLEKERRPR